MKLLIASDIHGSAYWCRKLLEVYQQEQPDKLVLLGDILYHGPRNDLPREYAPKAVISMLSPLAERWTHLRSSPADAVPHSRQVPGSHRPAATPKAAVSHVPAVPPDAAPCRDVPPLLPGRMASPISARPVRCHKIPEISFRILHRCHLRLTL